MTLALSVTARNNMLDEIAALVDAGSGAGLLRLYDSSRPASGGAATTLLAELTFGDPSFGAASSGALTANSISDDSSANATGTCTWFRVVDSDANFVIDGDAADLNMNTTSITSGVNVSVSSFVINAGNA